MDELKSVRQILEELAAGDDRLRDSFPKWLAAKDRQKQPLKKPPAVERPSAETNKVSQKAASNE
jgi:hypothetical protein